MSRSSELLHAWMSKRNHRSQSDAAKDLGVRPSAVNNWLQGVSHPKPAIAARMARDVGWDELKTLADLEAERCKGEDARVWKRLASAAVLCLAVGMPYSAKAEPLNPIYIMRSSRRKAAVYWLRQRWGSLRLLMTCFHPADSRVIARPAMQTVSPGLA